MPSFSLSRRRARRRTPEPVERRLDRLLADPLYSVRSDNEFGIFVTRQFDRVFGTDPMEVDASGRGIDPPPLRTDIESFRPKVRADDLEPGAPVGKGAQNRFADVLGLQRVLSRTGAYDFDIAGGERSGEARPRLVQAIQRFQEQSGLKVDGRIHPAGPTIKTLGQNLFGQGKAPPPRCGTARNPRGPPCYREPRPKARRLPTLLPRAQARALLAPARLVSGRALPSTRSSWMRSTTWSPRRPTIRSSIPRVAASEPLADTRYANSL